MTRVSVVIPARNAGSTLGETIASLRAQTLDAWEAIVVDDGSTDDTAWLARRLEAADPRVRVVRGEGRGVSAARNVGLDLARGACLLLLDADDVILPEHLERTIAPLDASPETVATHCGWARIDPTGRVTTEVRPGQSGDLFAAFAHSCLFPIHACLVRTEIVRRFGGLDESLVTCEDWDLWLRVARSGRPFAVEPETLSHYRMRERSASQDGRRMLADGLRVLERARERDPRVPDDVPHAEGLTATDLPENRFHHLAWTAGLVIGSGGDAVPLLDALEGTRSGVVEPTIVAGCLHAATPLPTCRGPHDWEAIVDAHGAELDRFLVALEEKSGTRRLAARARTRLEELVALGIGSGVVGRTAAVVLEVSAALPPIAVPPNVSRLACRVLLEGRHLGDLVVPVCEEQVDVGVVSDAVAARFAWPILTRFLEHQGLIADHEAGHGTAAWTSFLRELFERPEWDADRFYELHQPVRASGEREAAKVIELGAELPTVAAGAGRDVVIALGGAPLGIVELGPGPWPPDALVAACARAAGFELARAFVRECLLGSDLRSGGSLRERIAEARARGRDPGVPAGTILGRRRPTLIGGPGSRRSRLPAGARDELAWAAEIVGELVRIGEEPGIEYDPAAGLEPREPTRPGPVHALGSQIGRPFEYLRRRTARVTVDASPRVPVLMYHRIEPGVTGTLGRYAVEPAMFARQLAALRDAGYRSTSLVELSGALRSRRPLPGSPVLLTFDDGTTDFVRNAWPALRRYGFGAAMFVVGDRVGTTNAWDEGLGAAVSLLDWDALRSLVRGGLEVGAHSSTHPFLTGLSNEEIVVEVARSRRAILTELGVDPIGFAYPYGDTDDVVAHFVGACGFEVAVTTEGRCAGLEDDPLMLPRLEIHDQVDPAALLAMLEMR